MKSIARDDVADGCMCVELIRWLCQCVSPLSGPLYSTGLLSCWHRQQFNSANAAAEY